VTETTGETDVVAVAKRGLSLFCIGRLRELDARDSREGACDPPLEVDAA